MFLQKSIMKGFKRSKRSKLSYVDYFLSQKELIFLIMCQKYSQITIPEGFTDLNSLMKSSCIFS
jgi:hypothetical protein